MVRATFRRLLADKSGLAVVEVGLAAPVLALFIVGIADISNAYSRKLALEQAAQRSIEKIMQTTATKTPDEVLQDEAVAQAGGDLTADEVTVTYSLYCDMVKQASYDNECVDDKKEARFIEVKIEDEYKPMFPIRFAPVDADGKYKIVATAGMRTQ